MTEERKTQIKNATPEEPVRLTREEMDELRDENKGRFQVNLGSGRYQIPAQDGSPASIMLSMRLAGYSDYEIAEHMGFEETKVARVLKVVY